MPRSRWTSKEERQYERIKESARARGASTRRAEELAARTVNKARREAGRTSRRTTSGTGNPNRPLEERTVRELRNRAAELSIEGRSRMRKAELIRAIRRRR
ncbi:MAG TPA: Rho termination factor N-terminal domain-containing protein [Longimicrobiales bacterium]|nr:Rho termination factor N-terminal domain-containing protein [Longimicrobiales bacterium]